MSRYFFCPACAKRLYQHGKVTSYRCNCGRSYDLVEGQMKPKVKQETKRVIQVGTEGYRMSADEYEAMQEALP